MSANHPMDASHTSTGEPLLRPHTQQIDRQNAMPLIPVVIKGAGDLATGVAVRLYRAGFPVVMTELATPLTVRRTVAFAQAVYNKRTTVEEIHAVRAEPKQINDAWQQDQIPIVVDVPVHALPLSAPLILVDAIMAKRNTGTRLYDADIVIALGPGFQAGIDCHAVVETNRGHRLGRVIWSGPAQPDTSQPGPLPGVGYKIDRVLRAPCAGTLTPLAAIGAKLYAGAPIARIQPPTGRPHSVIAPFTGVLRGLIHPNVHVYRGMKIGDLDPRAEPEHCYTVSDKSLAVGGGVLEAICVALRDPTKRAHARPKSSEPRKRSE